MIALTIMVTEDEYKILELLVRQSVHYIESVEYDLGSVLAPKIVDALYMKGLVDVRLVDGDTGSVRLSYAGTTVMNWQPKPLAVVGESEAAK